MILGRRAETTYFTLSKFEKIKFIIIIDVFMKGIDKTYTQNRRGLDRERHIKVYFSRKIDGP